MTLARRRRLVFAALPALAVAGLLVSMLAGPVRTTPRDLWDFLAHGQTRFAAIFLHLRLARAVLAFLVGACLSLSGAILQGYFQNPMADPFVVGVSSGASFGAVLALALGLGGAATLPGQGLAAFAAGLIIVGFVYALASRKGAFKMETLLLTGLAAGALASALTSFLLFLRSDSYEQAVFWLLGSLALADWGQAAVVAPVLVLAFAGARLLARDMNLLALGDETARALGSPVAAVRKGFLVLATLPAALAVAVSGVIGFVGLIVPHSVRLATGPDHRTLFGASALAGGVFLIWADLLARTLMPAELPIGVVTAAFGAPFFIALLAKRRPA